MPDSNLDISRIKVDNVKKKNFPGKSDYRIYISEKAYKDISDHASKNTKVEIGGVLLGSVCQDNAGYFLEITNIITAQKTENTVANVTFTHETWADILNKKDTKFSDKLIVGWYHSHPDFDIFLSAQDLHIHENFFNQPHQVAFVIDPINNTEGFFIWKEGQTKLIEEYWVGETNKFSFPKKINLDGAEEEQEDSKNEEGKSGLVSNIIKWSILALYILALLLMTYLNFGLKYNLSVAENKIKEYEKFLSVMESVYAGQNNNTNTGFDIATQIPAATGTDGGNTVTATPESAVTSTPASVAEN